MSALFERHIAPSGRVWVMTTMLTGNLPPIRRKVEIKTLYKWNEGGYVCLCVWVSYQPFLDYPERP